MTINEKLLKVQEKLKAPKGQFNSFGNYKYRSCEDILEATKPLCVKEGLLLILSDKIVNYGDRYYVRAKAQLYDGDQTITVYGVAREAEIKKGMDTSQITGSTSSYARKYALNGLFCIDDTKDADTQDNSDQQEQPPKKATEKKATEKQTERAAEMSNSMNACETIDQLMSLKAEIKQETQKFPQDLRDWLTREYKGVKEMLETKEKGE